MERRRRTCLFSSLCACCSVSGGGCYFGDAGDETIYSGAYAAVWAAVRLSRLAATSAHPAHPQRQHILGTMASKKIMSYGMYAFVVARRRVRPAHESDWLSARWELGSQGLQDHPGMHVLRRSSLARMGPPRRRGSKAHQVRVRI